MPNLRQTPAVAPASSPKLGDEIVINVRPMRRIAGRRSKRNAAACPIASKRPQWPPVEVATLSHFWCEQLGCVSHAPLGLGFNGSLWFRRQLQNRCLLAFTQACQQHDTAIRKFQRIVMRRNLVFVDLPKDRGLMRDYFIAPGYQARR
jgi:hypothetical protein